MSDIQPGSRGRGEDRSGGEAHTGGDRARVACSPLGRYSLAAVSQSTALSSQEYKESENVTVEVQTCEDSDDNNCVLLRRITEGPPCMGHQVETMHIPLGSIPQLKDALSRHLYQRHGRVVDTIRVLRPKGWKSGERLAVYRVPQLIALILLVLITGALFGIALEMATEWGMRHERWTHHG